MSQGVAYQDANGNITDVNPAAERILRLSFNRGSGQQKRWFSIILFPVLSKRTHKNETMKYTGI